MTPLDPVEVALAVIGVRPVISKTVERVTAAQGAEMVAYPRTIVSNARAVCAGELASVPFGAFNYDKTLKDLSEGYDEDQLVAMVQKFPEALNDLASEFIVKAGQTVQLLSDIFPRQLYIDLLGPKNLIPAELTIRRFVSILDVIDDPMRVFPLMGCGALLASQRDTVVKVYPTISKAITESLRECAERELAAKKSFQFTARANIGIGTWIGRAQVTPQLATLLAASAAKLNTPTPNPQRPERSSPLAKESMTNTQHALYPQATEK